MAKRQPITLTDNPLAAAPARVEVDPRLEGLNGQTAETPRPTAAGASASAPSPAKAPKPRRARSSTAPKDAGRVATAKVGDPVLGPARFGPSLDEAVTTVFARVPESIALAFERMTLAVRQTERQPSQKALPAQELLGALLWRYGNGDDPEAVRELIELLREYRAARYAASIKQIETTPAAS
jgi:hypothetical protein